MASVKGLSSAEEVLVEFGAVNRRSASQRELIACLGCHFIRKEMAGQEPSCSGTEIMECTGLTPGTIFPILHRLLDAGVLVSEVAEPDGSTGRPKTYYYLAENKIGNAFQDKLKIPSDCPYI